MDIKFAEDRNLVLRVQQSACDESLKELILRHTPLCYKIYQNYLPLFIELGKVPENFESEKDYIIYKAACSFNPAKAKFVTWVGQCVTYFCLNLLRADHRISTYDSDTINFFIDKSAFEYTTIDVDLRDYIMNILGKLKDKRIEVIYKMRYFDNPKKNTSWREIAKRLDISIQTAINLHESVQKLLKEKLTSQQYSDII